MRIALLFPALLAAALVASPSAQARDNVPAAPPSGVIGVGEAQLTPAFWVHQLAHPQALHMDRAQIAAQNARLLREDDSMHDLRALPKTLTRAQVLGWIDGISKRPTAPRYDVHGAPVPASTLDALVAALDRDGVPATQPTRYGLVVHRAALRSFPTDLRVFSHPGDTDIDRFQESGIFPGTPVAIVHQTRDGAWSFVVSPRYAAWMKTRYLAAGDAARVFGYVDKKPYRVVTGAKVRTVHTREVPQVSELQLDMGVRVPLLTDWPADKPVNGQTPYTSWVVELPIRRADGSLDFSPALIQKNADTAADYLPLTSAGLIGQAFKFLGERYGWGHAYNGRDCSGFVSDVYRSFGVQMPRNTSAQGVSPALEHTGFGPGDSRARRLQAVAKLQVGDLIYIPGHVMMMLGRIDGKPYVIHDTGGMRYRTADGALRGIKLNAVSVTPLLPLLFNDRQSYVDRMTSIVRIRP